MVGESSGGGWWERNTPKRWRRAPSVRVYLLLFARDPWRASCDNFQDDSRAHESI